MVDLFFYRDPEEEREAEEAAEGYGDYLAGGDITEWSAQAEQGANWEEQKWSNAGEDEWASSPAPEGAASWENQGLSVPVQGWDA